MRAAADLLAIAAPLLIVAAALYLVLAWLGIVEGDVSGWAAVAALVGVGGIVSWITED